MSIPNQSLPSLARLRLLNVLRVRLRRLNPRRLGFIFDLKLGLDGNLLWRLQQFFNPVFHCPGNVICKAHVNINNPAFSVNQ